jgi:hypothetical protein
MIVLLAVLSYWVAGRAPGSESPLFAGSAAMRPRRAEKQHRSPATHSARFARRPVGVPRHGRSRWSCLRRRRCGGRRRQLSRRPALHPRPAGHSLSARPRSLSRTARLNTAAARASAPVTFSSANSRLGTALQAYVVTSCRRATLRPHARSYARCAVGICEHRTRPRPQCRGPLFAHRRWPSAEAVRARRREQSALAPDRPGYIHG